MIYRTPADYTGYRQGYLQNVFPVNIPKTLEKDYTPAT